MESNGNQNLPPTSLCRTGCGFYGNPAFDGMCSKCYKDALKRKQNSPVTGRTSPTTTNSTSVTDSAAPQTTSPSPVATTTPCIDTATTTVPTATPTQNDKESDNGSDDAGAEGGATAGTSSDSSDSPEKDKKPKKNRCTTCKKKVGLTGFQCRCGGLYCSLHRYSDKHGCSFDYKEMAQEQIRKNNPVVVGEKIQKI